ncbi:fimbria/pilus periplasmic chaperone [Chromobacterium haemolyticum]|uniref:EcpB family pilus assembly chaperone n=1 Tax=Chromobacterium haemolyticum TaxID=394935 RepID=UPI0009D92666|nr:fimbria/pilus periplasmic chaperone [Chromobacterium haemolyticum]
MSWWLRFHVLACLLLPAWAGAIQVSDMTSAIPSDKGEIAIHVRNTEKRASLLTVSVTQVDSPYEGAHEVNTDGASIQFTPARILLAAGQDQPVRFIYSGPRDDRERYYKVTWKNTLLGLADDSAGSEKSGDVEFLTGIKTNLLVFPKRQHFSYAYQRGRLANQGNVSFQAIAYGPCRDKQLGEVCKERYWIGPGYAVNFKTIDVSKHQDKVMLQRDGKFLEAEKETLAGDA